MSTGDPITKVEMDFVILHGALLEAVPYGYRCVTSFGSSFVIAQSTENLTWLRGHHNTATSIELQAMLAAHLLLR